MMRNIRNCTVQVKKSRFLVARDQGYIRQFAYLKKKLSPWQNMSKTSFLSVLCRPSIPKMFCLRDIISNAKLFQGVWRAIFSLYSSALQQLKSNQKQSSSENSRKKRGNWFPSVFACFREHLPHNFRSPCTLILFISRSIILTRSRTFSYHIRFGDKNSLDCIDCFIRTYHVSL